MHHEWIPGFGDGAKKKYVSMEEFSALWDSYGPGPKIMRTLPRDGNYNYAIWHPAEKCWWVVHPEST